MRKFLAALLFFAAIITVPTMAQKSNADLAQNLMATNQSFATDLKDAGLLEMLEEKGPYTIFAPSNELYKLAPELEGAQKISYLKSFIVAQNITPKELAAQFKNNNNQIQFTNLNGSSISLTRDGEKIFVNLSSGATMLVVNAPEPSNNGSIIQLEKMN